MHPFSKILWLVGGLSIAACATATELTIEEFLPESYRDRYVDPRTVAKHPSFLDGEVLKFELGWSFFKVARSEMVVRKGALPGEPALPAVEIELKTRTNSFADAIYKVRNTSRSWLRPDISGSLRFHAEQVEGSRERDTEAIFDPGGLTARYVNNRNGEERAAVDVLPGSFDPLGIVFFVRSLDFKEGDELVIPTSNGKEFFFTVVRVTGKTERRFSFGKMEAWVLEPDIKDLGGVFKRSENGRIRFYFSADERKLPLRMESEVAVGSFWAELISWEGAAD